MTLGTNHCSETSPSLHCTNTTKSCRTTRCKLPNVDPETGIADRNEPGVTMRQYRVIDKGSNSACLGMQVTPLSTGHIAVGEEVAVLKRGEHFYLKA